VVGSPYPPLVACRHSSRFTSLPTPPTYSVYFQQPEVSGLRDKEQFAHPPRDLAPPTRGWTFLSPEVRLVGMTTKGPHPSLRMTCG
jgi:hypothetical protein